jgi:hypothetical protein
MQLLGFHRIHSDYCIYKWTEGEKMILVVLYVDDVVIGDNCNEERKRFQETLRQKWDMKDLGELRWCLGLRVTRNREDRTITLDQEKYSDTILIRFGMDGCKPRAIPMSTNTILSKDAMSAQTDAERVEVKAVFNVQAVIGCLIYLVMCTRPDLAFAVGALSRYVADPGMELVRTLKGVMRYIKGTKAIGLTLGGLDTTPDDLQF